MTYIENILICLALPLLLSMFFTAGRARRFSGSLLLGMVVCLLSAYVSSFFMSYYATDAVTAAIEIAPVCEEILKLLPLLFYYLIFEPQPRELPSAALAIAVGFATFENVCYLTENGAENIYFLLVRGLSAGALHIFCGVLCGFGLSYVFPRRWLALTGTFGILGFCIGFHAIYNLLSSADGAWRMIGYLFPACGIFVLYLLKKLLPRLYLPHGPFSTK